jgi:hypothetical protein
LQQLAVFQDDGGVTEASTPAGSNRGSHLADQALFAVLIAGVVCFTATVITSSPPSLFDPSFGLTWMIVGRASTGADNTLQRPSKT